MTDILKEDEYQEIVSAAEQQTLDAVLCYSTSRNSARDDSFDTRKRIFFYVLSRLLTEGRIKLAKNGRFLNGTIQEQIDCFKSAYPDSEEELDDGICFFDDNCPGGAVWILEDGFLVWS
ncbi:DUF596 domain-containing protein [Pseudocitrobacter sp. 73]|uniref:DUF596 domain-containing protein n=1 Tax=Pseudocitrobacter sp. 73 TaxID=2605731 RepID=UPI0011F03C0A|nr:DUF596 domain-containing protein [Pseudocitrobacter sp. 73]KAA1045557.1 DUF596 domain-containing protein [Pseudocitrobacter sp. 73]